MLAAAGGSAGGLLASHKSAAHLATLWQPLLRRGLGWSLLGRGLGQSLLLLLHPLWTALLLLLLETLVHVLSKLEERVGDVRAEHLLLGLGAVGGGDLLELGSSPPW